MHLFQSAFLRALGWSLVDSVWQMGFLWLIYILVTGGGKKFNAAVRHSLALLSILAGSAWFLAELVYNLANRVRIAFSSARETLLLGFRQFAPTMEAALPVLSALYLIVSMLLFIQLIRQYRHTRRLAVTGLHKADANLRLFTREMGQQMHLASRIEVWLSDHIDSPLTIGFWKPLILLPVSAVNKLSIDQAESIILHELHHIKRNDYLVNLMVAFSTVVLFFNPFARLLSISLRNEREHSCDDLVMQFKYQPAEYAAALLILEQHRGGLNLLRVQATGHQRSYLLQRVRRILTGEPTSTPVSHRMLGVFISFLFIGFIGWHGPASRLSEAMLPSMAEGFVRLEMREQPLTAKTVIPSGNPGAMKPTMAGSTSGSEAAPATEPEQLFDFVEHTDEPVNIDQTIPGFASEEYSREFSLQAPDAFQQTLDPNAVHPYIPSSTLEFAILEDTAVPKPALATLAELRANEAKQRALLALKEMNWMELEKNLRKSGQKLNVLKLQQEIQKALVDVDWKRISADTESADVELAATDAQLQKELSRFQQERSEKARQLNQIREKLIIERLENSAAKSTKQRKIVSL